MNPNNKIMKYILPCLLSLTFVGCTTTQEEINTPPPRIEQRIRAQDFENTDVDAIEEILTSEDIDSNTNS